MDASNKIDPLLECLLLIGRCHGRQASRVAVTAGLPLDEQGLTPGLFARAAQRLGLAARVLSKSLTDLRATALPAVLLLENNQACVLLGWSKDRTQAQVAWPELPEGQSEISHAELKQQYTGAVIYARPTFTASSDTDQQTLQTERHWFWSALRENLSLYRDVLLAALFINLFALALPLFTMNVYDRVVPNYALETLWALAIGVGIVMLADLFLRTLRAWFIDLAGKRIDLLLSARIMERVLGMQLSYRPLSIGAFASNLRGFETVRDFITSASLSALIDLPFTALFIAVLFWIAPPLVLPALAGVVLVLVISMLSQGRMRRLSEKLYRASAQRNAVLIESLAGLEALKAMAAEGRMQRKWEQATAQTSQVGVRLRLQSALTVHLVLWAQQMVSVSVIVLGVYLIAHGELSLGGLIAASMLSSRAMAPLGQASALLTQYHSARTALESLSQVMEQPMERDPARKLISPSQLRGEIEFRHVSFSYPHAQQQTLNDLSFRVQPGERVAILGRIGSGKSTLQKLMMGLYPPDKGTVLVDGMDLRQLDLAALRRQVGYVPQEPELFSGTLRENLTLGDSAVADDALLLALERAQLAELVSSHPHGLEMQLGERGSQLSGGQRKAVVLARALLHEPPLLLFDEATGSMDHAAESGIKQQLELFLQWRTLVLVTHRTALLKLVDRIMVVDQGQIVADGPRDRVMEALRKGRIGRAQ